MDRRFTILDNGEPVTVPARVDAGRVWVSSAALTGGTPAAPDLVELEALAARLGRPLALDVEEGAAYLGVSASDRTRPLAALRAPGFTLPDLEGRLHSLSNHLGQKVLLVVYASW
jgi:hypothetical protein